MRYGILEKDFSLSKWISPTDEFLHTNDTLKKVEGTPWIWPEEYCRQHLRKSILFEENETVFGEFVCDSLFSLYVNGKVCAETVREFKGDITSYFEIGENTVGFVLYQTDSDEYFTSAISGKITVGEREIPLDTTWTAYRTATFWENDEPTDWLTTDNITKEKIHSCEIHPRSYKRSVYIRKKFNIQDKIEKVTLYASEMGQDEIYINGMRIDNGLLPQGINEKYREYREEDITDFVVSGENVIGIIMANGWLNSGSHTNIYMFKPRFIGEIEIKYQSGKIDKIVTDKTFKCAFSPYVENDIQYGEKYDASMEIDNWNCINFDDTSWANVEEKPADLEMRKFVKKNYEPVRIVRTVKPISSKEYLNGFLYDFGENCAGRFSLKMVNTEKHQKVRINMFERFNSLNEPQTVTYGAVFFDKDSLPDGISKGNLRNFDIYWCKGGNESFEPHFTFTGFRYIYLEGLEKDQIESIVMTVMHNDFPQTGKIESNYSLLNRLFDATKRSMLSNFVNGPMDCPTREKNFWTGDTQLFAPTACYLSDQSRLLARWTDGGRKMCPDVYGWGDEIYIVPWTLYKFYRDKELLKVRYSEIKDYAEDRISKSHKGLPYKYESPFNDHAAPLFKNGDKLSRTNVPADFFSASYYCYMLKSISRIAEVLGEFKDADRYASLSKEADRAFLDKYFISEENDFLPKNQASLVLPLAFDIVPINRQKLVAKKLYQRVMEEKCINVGIAGYRYLFGILADYGYFDAINMLFERKEYPSWRFMLDSGIESGTTITESWEGYSKRAHPSSSLNHFMYGTVTGWMFEYLGGIRFNESTPGFAHLVLKPTFIKEIGAFKTEYNSYSGKISVEWHFEGDTAICTFSSKVNVTFILPDKTTMDFEKGEHTITYTV